MIEVLLVRHGETDWNASGRWQGQTDIPLNDAGVAQARRVAARLARERADAVFASDLLRAFRTAELIAAPLGLVVQAEPGLREIDVGGWAGLTSKEAAARDPELHRRIHAGEDLPRGGNGERFADLVVRAGAAFDAIVARAAGSRLVLVTHGGVVRAILQHAVAYRTDLKIPSLVIGNTAVTTLARGATRWELLGLDDRTHLDGAPPALDLMAPPDDAERV